MQIILAGSAKFDQMVTQVAYGSTLIILIYRAIHFLLKLITKMKGLYYRFMVDTLHCDRHYKSAW